MKRTDAALVDPPERGEYRDYLDGKRQNLTNYLWDKVRDEDWHAVADAANDLRELDKEIEIFEQLDKARVPL